MHEKLEDIAGRVYDALTQDGMDPYRARYILCSAFHFTVQEANEIAENSPWTRITKGAEDVRQAVEEFKLACEEIEEDISQ